MMVWSIFVSASPAATRSAFARRRRWPICSLHGGTGAMGSGTSSTSSTLVHRIWRAAERRERDQRDLHLRELSGLERLHEPGIRDDIWSSHKVRPPCVAGSGKQTL